MDVLAFVTLVVGFTACAEFGSWAFVHPVLWRLPKDHHLAVEQGLLRTFGRVMPILMPASLALAIWDASVTRSGALLAWLGVAALAVALLSTVIANVPINFRTGRLDVTIGEPQRSQGMSLLSITSLGSGGRSVEVARPASIAGPPVAASTRADSSSASGWKIAAR
jgi:hypothetical protein